MCLDFVFYHLVFLVGLCVGNHQVYALLVRSCSLCTTILAIGSRSYEAACEKTTSLMHVTPVSNLEAKSIEIGTYSQEADSLNLRGVMARSHLI